MDCLRGGQNDYRSSHFQTAGSLGTQPERKKDGCQNPCNAVAEPFPVSPAEIDEQDTHQIIVICAAAIVPHNAIADSLMDEISTFVEENTEAEILDELREIR